MTVSIGLTFDCANPTKLAQFWKLALGYEDMPPPAPVRHQARVARIV
jgi:Glyoxalase-like domain